MLVGTVDVIPRAVLQYLPHIETVWLKLTFSVLVLLYKVVCFTLCYGAWKVIRIFKIRFSTPGKSWNLVLGP